MHVSTKANKLALQQKSFLGNNIEVLGQASVALKIGVCSPTKVFYSVNNNVELWV